MRDSRTILITGASAGIGRHAALHLARLGHRVIATARRLPPLDDLAVEAAGLPLETLMLDVTSPESIEAARAEVDRRTGGRGVDVLINNAGFGQFGPLELVGDAELRRQFETNVFGLLAVTRAFVPRMRERGSGRVVNVSSIGGRLTFPFAGAYHASKYAVEAMSDALRKELGLFGIEVVLIEPGPVQTEFAGTAVRSVDAMREDYGPYGMMFDRIEMVRKQSDLISVGPEETSRAIQRAVQARRPRARYVVPGRMSLLLLFFAMLPARLADWVMLRSLGVQRRRPAQLMTARGQ